MTKTSAHDAEPRLVLFAPADRVGEIGTAFAGVAAIVITQGADGLDEDLRAALRATGTPVLKLSEVSERAHGFDGLHLSGHPDAVKAARKALPAGAMLGAGNARTRHAAMQLGEAMPDYVLLGRIAGEDMTDLDIAVDGDLIEWWTALFELPCVAVADTIESLRDADEAGADFVAVNRIVWSSAEPASTLAGLTSALTEAGPRATVETDA